MFCDLGNCVQESESSGDETRCLLGPSTNESVHGCENDLFNQFNDKTEFVTEDSNAFWSLVERVSLRETNDDLHNVQLVLEMSGAISPKVLGELLYFIYTGDLQLDFSPNEVRHTLFDISHFCLSLLTDSRSLFS